MLGSVPSMGGAESLSGNVNLTGLPRPGRTRPARPAGLSLGALGVVYGDIGTSPLYAIKECFHAAARRRADARERARRPVARLLGADARSWSSSTSAFVMRADNHGEGGILALLALLIAAGSNRTARRPARAPALARSRSASSAPRCSSATA